MSDQFNFKNFEKVRLKAIYPIDIGSRTFEAGETIALFDNIQIGGLKDVTSFVAARGGYGNSPKVFWEETKEQKLNFSQGVFSKTQFALLTNAKMFEESTSNIIITRQEELESGSDKTFQLTYTPYGNLFIYNKETGEKITDYSIKDKIITLSTIYTSVIVVYDFLYNDKSICFKFGQKLFNGYLELEGYTRVKDDETGKVTTGIIKIPKVKLLSALSMRLGNEATPMLANFEAICVPVGSKGNSYISEFHLLSEDIVDGL